MTTDDKIKNEKLKCDINREVAKILALSSGKIDKYKYITGEEILPSDQSKIIEPAKFTYPLYSMEKALEKQTKKIKIKKENEFALKVLKPDTQQLTIKNSILKDHLNEEAKNEFQRIIKIESMMSIGSFR